LEKKNRAVALHVEGDLSAADAARVKSFYTDSNKRVVYRASQLFAARLHMK